MFIRWKTDDYLATIEPIECVRESEEYVWVLKHAPEMAGGKTEERKYPKCGAIRNYHDTWNKASAFLIARIGGDLEDAREQADLLQAKYETVVRMRKPDDA
jgi:hypothetical protein